MKFPWIDMILVTGFCLGVTFLGILTLSYAYWVAYVTHSLPH